MATAWLSAAKTKPGTLPPAAAFALKDTCLTNMETALFLLLDQDAQILKITVKIGTNVWTLALEINTDRIHVLNVNALLEKSGVPTLQFA